MVSTRQRYSSQTANLWYSWICRTSTLSKQLWRILWHHAWESHIALVRQVKSRNLSWLTCNFNARFTQVTCSSEPRCLTARFQYSIWHWADPTRWRSPLWIWKTRTWAWQSGFTSTRPLPMLGSPTSMDVTDFSLSIIHSISRSWLLTMLHSQISTGTAPTWPQDLLVSPPPSLTSRWQTRKKWRFKEASSSLTTPISLECSSTISCRSQRKARLVSCTQLP